MDDPKKTLVPSRHRASLALLREDRWIGAREGGVPGTTQEALERLGVAEVAVAKRPYRHHVARLTPLGVRWLELYDPEWKRRRDELLETRRSIEKIDADRVANATCRHCGGSVPCWSEFGDAKVGKRWDEIPEEERTKIAFGDQKVNAS